MLSEQTFQAEFVSTQMPPEHVCSSTSDDKTGSGWLTENVIKQRQVDEGTGSLALDYHLNIKNWNYSSRFDSYGKFMTQTCVKSLSVQDHRTVEL